MAGAGAPDAAAAAAAAAKKTLIQSPTNLKEAIDWILRLTGKDECLCLLSEVIHDLVRDVESHLSDEELEAVRGTLVDLQGVEGTRRITELLQGVSSGLQKFIGYSDGSVEGVKEGDIGRDGIGRCGKTGGKGGCTCGGSCGKGNGTNNQKYESSYDKGSGSGTDDMSWDKIYDSCTTGSNGSGTSGTVSAGSGTSGTLETLARILLGAIPLVFSGLSYLYWMAFALNGFRSTSYKGSLPLKHYVMRMGYKWDQWRLVKGGGVHLSGLITLFDGCSLFGGVEPGNQNYATFLDSLRGKAILDTQSVTTTTTTTTVASGQTTTDTKHSLIILNTICSGYFRSLHTIDSIRSNRPRLPRTVREILYWLTSLPYCPIYRTLVPKVQEMIQRIGSKGGSNGKVVFYGVNVGGNEKVLTVTPGNVASYLLGAALVAPMVLLTIQDTIDCLVGKNEEAKKSSVGEEKSYKLKNSKPVPIHDLYANMQFYFSYPMSETQSYYLLQDCLVALFYQMYFLKHVTFSDYTGGFAWGWCKYGDKVVCDQISGWMCPEAVTNGEKYWDAVKEWKNAKDEKEKSKEKKKQELQEKENAMNAAYKKVINQEQCGQDSTKNPSPLQAFLTDCLKGFTCPVVMEEEEYQKNLEKLRKNSGSSDKNSVYPSCYPPFLSHRGHTDVFGQECAVPMGFSGCFREGSGTQPASGTGTAAAGQGMIGLGIQAVLRYYTNDDVHSSVLYQITRCICSLTRRVPRSTGTLFGFFHGLGHVLFHRQITKNGKQVDDPTVKNALSEEMERCPGSSNTNELLDAINNWRGSQHPKDNNCLTLDSIQNCKNAPTCGPYLQPITGSLYNSMATQFTETYVSWIIHLTYQLHRGLESLLVEFTRIDCSKSGCSKKGGGPCDCCKGGNHGTDCRCASVVDCVGVHGLFYRFGFTYRGPDYLSHNGTYGNYKRTCSDFHIQLHKVINEGPFTKLLKQLRKFIYSTRALFGVYIGVYWLAVMVYLLWSMTVNLDLVHIQSHWRSPRSYLVPLQRILADGSRNIKGFCTLGYFQESGDRLLSEGISDVYL